jgi:diguanylate cyclase (GGDEF)-like protein
LLVPLCLVSVVVSRLTSKKCQAKPKGFPAKLRVMTILRQCLVNAVLMTTSTCSQIAIPIVHLLSLLEDGSLPDVLISKGIQQVDSLDDLCADSVEKDSVILLLAQVLNSELRATLERIQLTLGDVAVVIALQGEEINQAIYLDLISLGVQEVFSLSDHTSDEWFQKLQMARARKQYEARLKRFSHYDPLTQLANRSLFQDRLEHNLIQNHRRARGMGLLFLDLDRFRVVNEIYGHHIGDRLLIASAERMLEKVRRSDTLARLGSNNFAVILDDVNDEAAMRRVSYKLSQSFAQPFEIAGHEIFISVSIGMELAGRVGYDVGELVRNAELALHQAKCNGRNASLLYQGSNSPVDKVRMGLESALHHAMERKELHLAYQPQLTVDGQGFAGVEALLRWQHPALGNVPPAVFIPVLEDTGLIEVFGRWVIEAACQQFAEWLRQGLVPENSRVSVNLSPRQFRQSELTSHIKDVLTKTGLPPTCLTLEVTESMLMSNLEQSVEMLTHLRELGVSVAIDDFGTGYSSLSYLKDLPIDYLKIDRVFVKDIVTDANDAAIANSIIGLAHNLGLKVVAEGVEDSEILEMLVLFGCDQYQGFFFARPSPPDEIPQLVQRCNS